MNSNSLKRTYHPKFTTYWGDGHGRDQYITFSNGGLQGQRVYGTKNTKVSWQSAKFDHTQSSISQSPSKEIAAIRYYGDGSGRDKHVVFCQGQLRPPNKNYRVFENGLRQPQATPLWEQKNSRQNQSSPKGFGSSVFKSFYSPANRQKLTLLSSHQRASIDRLAGSPTTAAILTPSSPKSPTQRGQTAINKHVTLQRRAISQMGELTSDQAIQQISFKLNSHQKAMRDFLDSKPHKNSNQDKYDQIKRNEVIVRDRPQKMSRGSYRTMTPAQQNRRIVLSTPDMTLDTNEYGDNGQTIPRNEEEYCDIPQKVITGTNSLPQYIMQRPQTNPISGFRQEQGSGLMNRRTANNKSAFAMLKFDQRAEEVLDSALKNGKIPRKTSTIPVQQQQKADGDSVWAKGAPMLNVAQLEKSIDNSQQVEFQKGKLQSAFKTQQAMDAKRNAFKKAYGNNANLKNVNNNKIAN